MFFGLTSVVSRELVNMSCDAVSELAALNTFWGRKQILKNFDLFLVLGARDVDPIRKQARSKGHPFWGPQRPAFI